MAKTENSPSEGRPDTNTIVTVHTPGGSLANANAIVEPLDLIRRQAEAALERGETSAAAYRGFVERVRDDKYGYEYGKNERTRGEFNKFLASNKDLIRSGLEVFGRMSQADVQRFNGAARIAGDPKTLSERFIATVEAENYEAVGTNYYTWEEVCSALEVAAQYQEEQDKEALEKGEISAAAYRGFVERVRDDRNRYDYGRNEKMRGRFNQFLASNKDLIRSGLEVFGGMFQADVQRLNGHARVAGDPKTVAEQFIATVEAENYGAVGTNYYTWEEVCSALEVAAEYQAEQDRKKTV